MTAQEGTAHDGGERRSLRYIRLAAFLARQPDNVERLEMSMSELEEVIGATLPPNARFPSWWRNDDRKLHSRAWLSAGWKVTDVAGEKSLITFVRNEGAASQA